MKKILLLIMIALTIVGCSNGETEDVFFSERTYIENGSVLSLDSIHYYSSHAVKDGYVLNKKRRDDKSIVWKTNVIFPDPFTVDLGYGNKQEVSFNQVIGPIFETSSLLFLECIAIYNLSYNSTRNYEKISLYSTNGKFIKHLDVNPQRRVTSFVRWKDGKVIMIEKSYYTTTNPSSYFSIIDKNGDIIESKENINLAPSDNPVIINDRKYISFNAHTLHICDLDKGTSTIELNDFILDKYPEEANKPKVEIQKIVVDNNIATVNMQIIFYSGEKKNSVIKIDIGTQEITEYVPNLS